MDYNNDEEVIEEEFLPCGGVGFATKINKVH
jgi:hypothetical protein